MRHCFLLVAALVLAACGGGDPARVAALYDTAPPAPVPAATDPVPAQGDLADGTYWASGLGGEGPDALSFHLVQWSFDGGMVDDPSRQLVTPAADLATVTVVDANTGINVAVDGPELLRLVAGEPPATPPGVTFTYDPTLPFLVSVRAGVAVSAFQIGQP